METDLHLLSSFDGPTSRFTGGEPYGNPRRERCVSSFRDAGSPYGGSDCWLSSCGVPRSSEIWIPNSILKYPWGRGPSGVCCPAFSLGIHGISEDTSVHSHLSIDRPNGLVRHSVRGVTGFPKRPCFPSSSIRVYPCDHHSDLLFSFNSQRQG